MFKTLITAAALTLTSLSAQAAPTPLAPLTIPGATALAVPAIEDDAEVEQTAYFCQWVTVYDYYGNWVTVWRCF
jgi:hypothetical protein